MDKQKIMKIGSIVAIGAGVTLAYFGGVGESGVLALVGVGFGVIAAIAAFLKG